MPRPPSPLSMGDASGRPPLLVKERPGLEDEWPFASSSPPGSPGPWAANSPGSWTNSPSRHLLAGGRAADIVSPSPQRRGSGKRPSTAYISARRLKEEQSGKPVVRKEWL